MSKNWILLRSGAAYTFGAKDAKLDFFQDVVVPLSRVVRYGGHTTFPWTVAAHAAVCAQVALKLGWERRFAKHCLHHDDAEALVGDMVSPLKRQLAEFANFEDAAHQSIALSAGYKLPSTEEEVAKVKLVDYALLEAERRLLKAPLTPGLTWNIEYDRDAAREAEYLVYQCLLAKENWGPGAEEFYLRMHKELS